jgi:hypothetical protein
VRSITAILATNLVAVWGLSAVVSFNFSLQLLQALLGFCMVPLTSNGPILASLLAQGRTDELKEKTIKAIAAVLSVYLLGALAIGLLGPIVLDCMSSNVMLLPRQQWWIFSMLFGVLVVNACFATVCNLDNRARFFWRNFIAGGIVILTMITFGTQTTVSLMIVMLTVPYILMLEFAPIRGYLKMCLAS